MNSRLARKLSVMFVILVSFLVIVPSAYATSGLLDRTQSFYKFYCGSHRIFSFFRIDCFLIDKLEELGNIIDGLKIRLDLVESSDSSQSEKLADLEERISLLEGGLSSTPTPTSTPTLTPTEVPTPSVVLTPTETPSPTLTPTITLTPSPSPTPGVGAGSVVINELMWMGTSTSTYDEWVELRNMTGEAIDLTGWVIENAGESGTPNVTLSGTISANGYFLLANYADTSSAIKDGVVPNQVSASISFAEGGEQLRLKKADSTLIDSTPNGVWPAGEKTDTIKHSMERYDPPGDGSLGASWHTCTNEACNDGTYWDAADGYNYGTPGSGNL